MPEVQRSTVNHLQHFLVWSQAGRDDWLPPLLTRHVTIFSLSFDILRDELGDGRTAFPHTLYLVAGTQAEKPGDNSIQLLRLTQLSRIQSGGHDGDDSDEDSSDSEDEGEEQVIKPGKPVLQTYSVPHHGGINRIRAAQQHPGIVATWGETGHVQIWDLSAQLQAVNSETATKRVTKTSVRVAPRQVRTDPAGLRAAHTAALRDRRSSNPPMRVQHAASSSPCSGVGPWC